MAVDTSVIGKSTGAYKVRVERGPVERDTPRPVRRPITLVSTDMTACSLPLAPAFEPALR